MASRKELETLLSTYLAVLCEKVAAISDVPTAAKALALRVEWVALQSPPSMNLKEEQAKDAKRLDLRRRMLDFLEGRDEVDWEKIPKAGEQGAIQARGLTRIQLEQAGFEFTPKWTEYTSPHFHYHVTGPNFAEVKNAIVFDVDDDDDHQAGDSAVALANDKYAASATETVQEHRRKREEGDAKKKTRLKPL